MSATSSRVELPITGMTCASCANRIERKLNKLDGVTASVNYATEKARVEFDPGAVAPEQLLDAVAAAGYSAALPATEPEAADAPADADETAPLRRRLIVAALLSLPALLLAMVPALQFDNFQWLSLNLATPVVLWAAWPFHKAAWANLKHGAATMDTLVSVGTLAAWLWSVYALFLGDAGMNDMRMAFDVIPQPGEGADQIYLETAGIVTTFLLAGRYFEARAKRRAGAALQALLELGAKDVAVLDADGAERRVAIEVLAPGDRFVVRPGEKVATDGVVEQGTSAVDMSILTGRARAARGAAGLRGRGRDRQRGWPPDRARHEGRRRHGAGPNRAAGHRRPDRQGARPATGRPHLRRVRPGGHRARRRDARLLARHRGERELRFHGGGRRADHRLPVRARARHADCADGRHRPGCATRAADQGPGGAGVDSPRRHRRPRQDRHGDHRPDDAGRRRHGGRRRPRRGAAAGRRAGERVRAPDRPGDRRGDESCATGGVLHQPRGSRRRGRGRRPRGRGRPPVAAGRLGNAPLARARRRPSRGRGARPDRRRRGLGRPPTRRVRGRRQ